MKVCPTCKRSYADDLLNFCLDDGSVLTAVGGSTADIYINQARPTVATPPTPRTMEANYAQPLPPPVKGSSKRGGIWAVAILGLIAVLCGGAAILGFLIANVDTSDNDNNVVNTRNNNGDNGSYGNDRGKTSSGDAHTVDLSEWAGARPEGTLEQQGSESVMWSKLKGYYFVLVAPQTFSTVNANTTLTVRNVSDANTSTGFGLVFHSDPQPLQNDYAFLVDSKRKRYRIVKHNALKETDVVKWTVSTAIKNGSEKNVLEVRDLSGTMEFFVNGRKLTSIRNERGSADGVPGLYSGDGIKVGFSELKVSN
jgi:hypothetical protein